jgi:hypothetical protein
VEGGANAQVTPAEPHAGSGERCGGKGDGLAHPGLPSWIRRADGPAAAVVDVGHSTHIRRFEEKFRPLTLTGYAFPFGAAEALFQELSARRENELKPVLLLVLELDF